jgi:hypothetical protein
LSLHIGLNAVDPAAYGGWSGDLMACEFDANDMTAIAKAQGMKPTTLLTKQATRAKVVAAVRAAAKTLASGDLFFVSYSGHGGQVPDVTGDEPDKKDETWCLYDGEVIDDEVYLELSRFAEGVRVLVLSDAATAARSPATGCRMSARARSAAQDDAACGRDAHPIAITRRSTTSCSATSPTRPGRARSIPMRLASLAFRPRLTTIAGECKASDPDLRRQTTRRRWTAITTAPSRSSSPSLAMAPTRAIREVPCRDQPGWTRPRRRTSSRSAR